MEYFEFDEFRIYEDGSVENTRTYRRSSPKMVKQVNFKNRKKFMLPVARLLLLKYKPLPDELEEFKQYAYPCKIDKSSDSVGIDNLEWRFPGYIREQIGSEKLFKLGLSNSSRDRKKKEKIYYIKYAEGYFEEISPEDINRIYGCSKAINNFDSFTVKSPNTGAVFFISKYLSDMWE